MRTKLFYPESSALHELIHQVAIAEHTLQNKILNEGNSDNGFHAISSNQIDTLLIPFRFALIKSPFERIVLINPLITGYATEEDIFILDDKCIDCFEVELRIHKKLEVSYLTLDANNEIKQIEEYIFSNEYAAAVFQMIHRLRGKTHLDLAFEKLTTNDLSFALKKIIAEIRKREIAGNPISRKKSEEKYCIVRATEKWYALDHEILEKVIAKASNASLETLKEALIMRLQSLQGKYRLHTFKPVGALNEEKKSTTGLVSKL